MRLIDTDRFAEISKHHIPEVLEDTFDEGYLACLKVVDLTPTVKAIPIEWILNWLSKSNRHYCDVDLMLEDWEKENETN